MQQHNQQNAGLSEDFMLQATSQSDRDPIQMNATFMAMAAASYAMAAKRERAAAIESGDVLELRAAA